ncbi:biotin--[acetyl-CoA-carboxylase] ligase [Desulfovibrio sp. OttesenSCG-928-I05]|nr:biotin--[acetyl-CoA-carboxylase] ligase [Desulfovibrio sp. OttesenSCG-928-I05]
MTGSIVLLEHGVAGLAEPLRATECASDLFFPGATVEAPWRSGEMTGAVLRGDGGTNGHGPVFLAGASLSTFDLAWHLHERGVYSEDWTAVIACSQQKGRGQLGRYWHSPAGNLYVSFLLPRDALFDTEAAALITGYMLLTALREEGLPLALKWPNDLLLEDEQGAFTGKVAGLLLEERRGRVVAGFGVNLREAPSEALLRKDRAIAAASLAAWKLTPVALWLSLSARLNAIYTRRIYGRDPLSIMRDLEAHLAWKGKNVSAGDAGDELYGRLLGLGPDGALRLETPDGVREIISGSVRL